MRTSGGTYYDEFVNENYIGISWNEITANEITKLIKNTPARELSSKMSKLVHDKYKSTRNPTRVGNQLIRFAHSIRKGDIVLIPNHLSQRIYFGEVQSDDIHMPESSKPEFGKRTPLLKRKSVKWIKEIRRDQLEPELHRAVHPHQALSNLNSYASAIDSTLNDFYIKGNMAYMILEINQSSGINAVELFSMGLNTLELISRFNEFSGTFFRLDGIETKVHVQSPGKIKLIGPIVVLSVLAALSVIVIGGNAEIDLGNFKIHLQDPGVIQEIINYKNSQADRQEKEKLVNSFAQLKVKTPNDVVNALKTLQNDNQAENSGDNSVSNGNSSSSNNTTENQ